MVCKVYKRSQVYVYGFKSKTDYEGYDGEVASRHNSQLE